MCPMTVAVKISLNWGVLETAMDLRAPLATKWLKYYWLLARLLDPWGAFDSKSQAEGVAGSQKHNSCLCCPLDAIPLAGHLP